jgi:adsorption protein B
MTLFLLVLSALYLLGGFDDLFMDLVFYCKPLRRALGRVDEISKTEKELLACPEKWIAILVPAWDESAVISRMVATNCERLEYEKYDIFVGTYPNDEATQFEVDKAAWEYPRVHKVVTADPGPTSKADCLNWIVEAIRIEERKRGIRYEIFVMQDSEDVVHPLVLRLFNALIPSYDMVQVPVLPYERPLIQLTGGMYLDEFAESHQKGLLARQAICGMVPSAGVGTGFGREALDELAEKSRNQLFRLNSLTEDYDFAFRLCENGRRSCVANVWVPTDAWRAWQKANTLPLLPSSAPGMWPAAEDEEPEMELIATREYFPARLRDAIRQRSRWMLGIVFQGWQHLGWGHTLCLRYTLFRDRKGLFSGLLNLISYGFLLGLLGIAVFDSAQGRLWSTHWPQPQQLGPWWRWAVILNLSMQANRILQRMICTGLVSDFRQVLVSPVRMLWASLVDIFTTLHALNRFTSSCITGQPMKWAKTAHEYPTQELISARHRKLGELLMQTRVISPAQLVAALDAQKHRRDPLGRILVEMNVITESQLENALQSQSSAS